MLGQNSCQSSIFTKVGLMVAYGKVKENFQRTIGKLEGKPGNNCKYTQTLILTILQIVLTAYFLVENFCSACSRQYLYHNKSQLSPS